MGSFAQKQQLLSFVYLDLTKYNRHLNNRLTRTQMTRWLLLAGSFMLQPLGGVSCLGACWCRNMNRVTETSSQHCSGCTSIINLNAVNNNTSRNIRFSAAAREDIQDARYILLEELHFNLSFRKMCKLHENDFQHCKCRIIKRMFKE